MNIKTDTKKIYQFEANAQKTLELVINSIYRNHEVFLRELISNASDACSKLRFLSISDQSLIEGDGDLEIKLNIDKDRSILEIQDSGIGMDENDLIKNIGTIASSDTSKFIEKIKESKDSTNNLIGKFGVGFYSAFMVAEEVIILTRKAGTKVAYKWHSNGLGSFDITPLDLEKSKEIIGCKIQLKIKDEHKEFLDKFRIQNIIESYSEYLDFPIKILEKNGKEELINTSNAIWIKNKNDVTEEEHKKFFNSIAHVGGSPWLTVHNHNEGGLISFINLLYIPSIKPFDLFHPDRKSSIKLYVNKVFITDDTIELVPKNLRFVKGIVDCSDIPLNVSRETLQNNRNVASIKKAITKKIINTLFKKLKDNIDEYKESFWSNFGAVLKEGLCESLPTADKEKLLSICLFYSIKRKEMISIDQYIENMVDNQNTIYYLSSNSIDNAITSPQVEGFISRDMDVLVLTDSVDDFWTNTTRDYKNIAIKSITRSNINLEKNDGFENDENKEKSNEHKDDTNILQLINYMKSILIDDISDVLISKKLTTSPICLSVQEGSMDIRMERFMIEQKQLHTKSKKILEINPKHDLIVKMSILPQDIRLNRLVNILFNQACIAEGEEIKNPNNFSKDLVSIMLENI